MEILKKPILDFINDNVIGKDSVFHGPYGWRKVLYCDYTASSKPLQCIEDYIKSDVLPMYANTHTTTCATALQMTYFRQEARDIVRNSVRASEHDAVIFTANGVTGAVHKLINALHLQRPPVVFCGPYEHHSNLLPWREIAAWTVRITETQTGVSLKHLEAALHKWSNSGLPMIGCFSAASNVTGCISDTEAISVLLHKYGALSVWDYATAAPYLDINMHPYVEHGNASKDAIFISPHKFVGGIGTPGVLVVQKNLLKNPIPSYHGGGSVFFVSEKSHTFIQDHELREEGGTPDIVGAVRCGLCFKLKNDVGCATIMAAEKAIYNKVSDAWRKSENIEILGTNDFDSDCLAIFSFLIRHPASGLYLHYSFVTALLNDLFGIQARGGCMCAGPYAQDLLGLSAEYVEKYQQVLTEDVRLDRRHLRRFKEYSKYEVLRPGFVRVTIPYFFNEKQVDFIINAVLFLAESAWQLLPQYTFDPDTGEWRHLKQKLSENRKWLGHVKFAFKEKNNKEPDLNGVASMTFEDCLMEAKKICDVTVGSSHHHLPFHDDLFENFTNELRWFLTPSEARSCMSKQMTSKQSSLNMPFRVRQSITQLSDDEIDQSIKFPEGFIESLQVKAEFNLKSWRHNISAEKLSNGVVAFAKGTVRAKACPLKIIQKPLGNPQFISPPKRLMKLTLQAIDEFKMIENGDRVLVCLSGGKDSLSLLHVLRQYQFVAKKDGVQFQLGAVTIDPKSSSYDPSLLKPYIASLGLPYFFEEQGILDQALALPELTSICSFCSRMKRGRLYHCARREGWNVLAMGQHLDDLAESFMMSFFQNGLLQTMKANYRVKEGDLRVIRPFSFVRERDTREFAEGSHLPIIPENCPACFEAPKERHRMKQMLASQEVLHPKLFFSIKEALRPLMGATRTGGKGLLINDDYE